MTYFIFKLRRNILLEGDLQLAQREIESFTGTVTPVADLSTLNSFDNLSQYTRSNGTQGYEVRADFELLPLLIERLGFVQRIYCITPDIPEARGFCDSNPVISYRSKDNQLYIQAIPHYALFELSDVVTRRTPKTANVRKNLNLMLGGLLGTGVNSRWAEKALLAQNTTGHLSHDIHYYKAKFFPRMARAMLNICARDLNLSTPCILDPFAGSGTTLLEAALMGMPATGVDLDPLSVLISKTKLAVLTLDSTLYAGEARRAIDALQSASPNDTHRIPLRFPAWLTKNRNMTSTHVERLNREINGLRAVIASADPLVRDVFRVLASDAISRHIKMRFLGTGSGRFALTFSKTPLHTMMIRSLNRYLRVIITWEWLRDTLKLSLAPVEVLQGDARTLENLHGFNIIVTSPPYLPASSGRETYAKARAPSLLALDMLDNVDELVDDSLGSMDSAGLDESALTAPVRDLVTWLVNDPLRSVKADPTARYFLDMRRSFKAMHNTLAEAGMAVIVSGRQSTFYRYQTREALYTVPVAEMLAEEAQLAGFEAPELMHIQLRKMNRNARPRSRDEYDETLLFLNP